MIVGLMLGCGLGVGVALTTWGLFPPRQPLYKRLTELSTLSEPADASTNLLARLGLSSAHLLARLGLSRTHRTSDLRVTGSSLERLSLLKIAALTVGAGFPVALWCITVLFDVWLSPALVASASFALGGLAFFIPDLLLRKNSALKRRDFKQQLSVYLDLLGLQLASGVGIERALSQAATQGTSWGFIEIQRSLQQAQFANKPPWHAFEQLAKELESPELIEISAWLMLAGSSGSRIRNSLHIKARGLRERAMWEAEAEAQIATDRMSLPVVLLFAGFLGLIGYPALAAIVGS